jgi:hypothetical protein
MEFFIEVVLQFLFEFLIQIIGEVASEFGSQSLKEVFRKRPIQNPLLAAMGYFCLGALIGGISLLVVNHALIHHPTLRIVNLFLSPLLAGLVMMAIGSRRQKKGQAVVRLDRFGYAFIFAFGMALIRFLFAAKAV